jgi:hypothetical protein
MLRTFEDNNIDLPPIMPFRSFISAASWAICSTYHTTLQATPGQLVFGRDMLLQSHLGQIGLKSKLENKDSLTKMFFAKTPREYNTNTMSETKYYSTNLAY